MVKDTGWCSRDLANAGLLPVRVLMVSTSFPETRQDWPGRFIANMAEALARREDVHLTLWAPPGEHSRIIVPATSTSEAEWLRQLLRSGGIAHLLRASPLQGWMAAMGLLRRLRQVYRRYRDVDVVHVNWLQNALPLWGNDRPAVISVLGNDFGLLRLPGMVAVLRAVLRGRRVILAPNADWMADELARRFGDLAEIRPIPFGVDDSWFAVERQMAWDGPRHWLVVTRLTRHKIGDLFDWGEGLFDNQRQLHLFGPMQETLTVPDWVHYHGSTHPKALLEEWFPTATGLVTLSRHDEGRPQVLLEAMAAGLPVVASNLPAHRDLIQSSETGVLVDSRLEFEAALRDLESPAANQSLGLAAREWIRNTIGTWDDCAARYHAAYQTVRGESG
ncbi:MAG: glycosyltransferase family 4 protein [Candidatus Contendobacter sp.]|nr:glycosyltransferase family 4 protein [Candidatus Contendobacter sp.]MDG4559287.1 glycosyltransferase family 4 protein [Candidatus Contendobacter sp.]